MVKCAVAAILGLCGLLWPVWLLAGELQPPGPPGPTMKTLEQIPPTWSRILPAQTRFQLVLRNGEAVLDKETGLVWERSPLSDDAPPYEDQLSWDGAHDHCLQLEVGGRVGWRLPTVEELASLVDPSQTNPALPSGHPFIHVKNLAYWSATTWVDSTLKTNYAWWVSFLDGEVTYTTKIRDLNVWCVRHGHGHDGY